MDYRQYYYNKYDRLWKFMVKSEGRQRLILKYNLEETITNINRIRTVLETDGENLADLDMVYHDCQIIVE